MKFLKRLFKFVVDTVDDFSDDNATTLAAALAFYTTLALAPLLMIFLSLASQVGQEAQAKLIEEIQGTVGPQAGQIIDMVVENLKEQHHAGLISAVTGGIALLLSASGVFAQLQFSMNTIWDVHAKPGNDITTWLRQRVLSLGMMALVGFLSLASLALSAALNFIFSGITEVWSIVDLLGSLVVYTLVFALIYKVMPDVRLAWHDVWVGAAITAILFAVGKFAIGKYLGYSSVASAFGAAGSLVVLLLWLYYTSLIIFMGAEMTQVMARRQGRGLVPKAHGEMDLTAKGPKTPMKAEAED